MNRDVLSTWEAQARNEKYVHGSARILALIDLIRKKDMAIDTAINGFEHIKKHSQVKMDSFAEDHIFQLKCNLALTKDLK